MKTYVMRRDADGYGAAFVRDASGERPLRHRVHHSPTGFEWGYNGSGPADLARSIVADVTGDERPDQRLYQAVKQELVSTLPSDGGEIAEAAVVAVIQRC